MPYTGKEIQERLSDNRKGHALLAARLHQQRIQFHTIKRATAFNLFYLTGPITQFLSMVDNILPHDKSVLFRTLFRFPVKTNEITEVCFDKLSRIFDGRNPSFLYQFTSPEYRADWEEYRAEKLKEPEIWQTKGWDFFKSEINSVLVVDLPKEQTSDLPEPYFYWVRIDDVLTYEANPDGQMRFILFRRGDKIIAIDDASYRVWDKGTSDFTKAPELETPHALGYCPAHFFWNEPLSVNEPDVKASPLSKELESLDWFEFFHISKRQLDLYGAYPVLSGYAPKCDFTNAENGDYCDGGFLRDRQGHYKMDTAGVLQRCPKCGDKRVVGAGSFVEIPIPSKVEGEEVPDLRNPVQMLHVDDKALKYNVEEEERLRNRIITSVVGQDEIITNRDAYNEQQVRANFENATTVLRRVKRGFESIIEWTDSTICRYRYGEDFIAAKINFGTEFFLFTTQELREQYKAAKEAGASEAELDKLQNTIIETEYRNDPIQQQRMMILAELEPYRHKTQAEMLELFKEGVVTREEMQLKNRFAELIRRFERENTNVLYFGEEIEYGTKIDRIREALKGYLAEAPAVTE